MHEENPTNLALEAALTNGPIERGISMVLLTDVEREHLIALLREQQTGPGASVRLKLRAAAPVCDAEWSRSRWRGFTRLVMSLFETDGREKGRCRWCQRRARIDQYRLCARCLPRRAEEQARTASLCEV